MIKLVFMTWPHTTDNVAAVILVPVTYIQQQVGAVRVGPVSSHRADHRLIFYRLIIPIKVQLSYTINDTGSNEMYDAAKSIHRLCQKH